MRSASPSAPPEPLRATTKRPQLQTFDDRAKAMRRALLRWYDRTARALPWRGISDSYRIWVSEVMLQQTRMAVVLPAYERFVAAFPTLAVLARASEEQVLSLWSGLGYYSRARALHRAARELHARGAHGFPRDRGEARALPGVGPYTVAAVQSIAFGAPLAAVDGNVIRVLSRLECLARPDARGEPHATLAGRLLVRERAGDWNQALMELGETHCTPKAPRCDVCPLATSCRARSEGVVMLHPPARPRRAPERVVVRMTVMHDRRGRILLERGAFPYLSHLWLPPARVLTGLDGANGAAPRGAVARRTVARRAVSGGALSDDLGREPSFRHAILHRQLDVRVAARMLSSAALDRAARPSSRRGFERRVVTRAELGSLGRSSLLTKALRTIAARPEA